MTEGQEVVRVSLRSDEGSIGERGMVRKVYRGLDGQPFGYYVEWERPDPGRGFLVMGYVAPVRIVTIDEWRAHEAQRKRDAA